MKFFFARPDALTHGTLAETIKFVKPTAFFGVPRIFEKFEEKIREKFAEASAIKKRIINWAQNIGRKSVEKRLEGKSHPFFFQVADKLLF